MSYSKRAQVFPLPKPPISEGELASMIGAALHLDYGESPSAIKYIGLQTGANLRAIKNWFQGRNTPSSRHLLILARTSPSILRIVLEQVGGSDLFDAFSVLEGKKFYQKPARKGVPINVPIKSSWANLNERQEWFLNGLRRGLRVTPSGISRHFSVALKTAKRDIAVLKALNFVIFVGARKTGRYQIS
jgi:hypothetical protein